MRILLLVLLLGFAAASGGSDQSSEQPMPQLNLMPMPSNVKVGNGALPISASFSVDIEGVITSPGWSARSKDFAAIFRGGLVCSSA